MAGEICSGGAGSRTQLVQFLAQRDQLGVQQLVSLFFDGQR